MHEWFCVAAVVVSFIFFSHRNDRDHRKGGRKACFNFCAGLFSAAFVSFDWQWGGMAVYLLTAIIVWRFLGMAIFIIVGISSFVLGSFSEQEQYKVLKEEPLILDYGYLQELSHLYQAKKRIYAVSLVPSIILFIVGILAVSFTMSGKFAWSEYHSFVFLGLATGLFGFCYFAGVMDAYELLVKNEQYSSSLWFKIKRRIKDKINKL
ncbi:hypothetical protein IMSAGC019_00073 [Lachnospiraceae bacterium]|nr:hypothetical protein IMSAGC019_00073 [Lachnospiraceae bacterium]